MITTSFGNCDNSFKSIHIDIDTKISKIANTLLENLIYGFSNNVKFQQYKDLITYKSILLDIEYLSDGMCDVNISFIKSKINKLINNC